MPGLPPQRHFYAVSHAGLVVDHATVIFNDVLRRPNPLRDIAIFKPGRKQLDHRHFLARELKRYRFRTNLPRETHCVVEVKPVGGAGGI